MGIVVNGWIGGKNMVNLIDSDRSLHMIQSAALIGLGEEYCIENGINMNTNIKELTNMFVGGDMLCQEEMEQDRIKIV